MRSLWIAIAAVAFTVGCKQKPAETPPAEPPPVAAVEEKKAVEDPAVAAEPEKPDEEEKVTPELVDKYVKYIAAAGPLTVKHLGAVKKAGEGGTMEAIAKIEEERKKMEDALAKARDEAGLNEEQLQTLSSLATDVTTLRKLWKDGGGEKNTALIEMKKGLADAKGATAAERAAAEEQIKNIETGMNQMRDATDARQRYGDAAVDQVIKHEAAIQAYRDQLMKAL